MGSDGLQKALGGHLIFMRCNGSKANILFQEQETSQESSAESFSRTLSVHFKYCEFMLQMGYSHGLYFCNDKTIVKIT